MSELFSRNKDEYVINRASKNSWFRLKSPISGQKTEKEQTVPHKYRTSTLLTMLTFKI